MMKMQKPEESNGEGMNPPVFLHGDDQNQDDWVQVVKRRNPKARPANNQGQAKKVVKGKVRKIT